MIINSIDITEDDKYLAHSQNEINEVHLLKEHLSEAAKLMERFAGNDKYKSIFRVTGLLHDFGKYQPAFQKYLREGGRRGSVPHASWGAGLSKKFSQIEAAFAIDGHHKGLPDKGDLITDLYEFDVPENTQFNSIRTEFFKENPIEETDLIYSDTGLRGTEKELFIRMLFSALTDADWLDTENHFNSAISEKRNLKVFDTEYLLEKLEGELKGKSKEGYINTLRNKVRSYAISKGQAETGFFSMTLPTGMGKTLASVSWALHHAKHNSLKRIIIVLPFISIIDQTAKELKRIFGEEWVLEHHSNYNEDEEDNKEIADESIQNEAHTRRLATENWDYPIIVTTSVQFFESLFGNKPSRCRKVHNIAQSVVIFDEVQTLPKELVLPTLSILKNVQKVMGTSFLFCTATQPAFEKSEGFNGIENIQSLVENPKVVFDATRRVKYLPVNDYYPVSIEELSIKVLEQDDSSLCIFNTKKQALSFFDAIRDKADYQTFHLSTSMFPAHRKEVIGRIRDCLSKKERILVSSTQLIEAGVDFDFPCVFREIAPLESIIQSAGRCNREGKMPEAGNVFIFAIEDAGTPSKQYRSLAVFANSLYKDNETLLYEHDFFGEYYRKVFRLFIPEDIKNIEMARLGFNFKTVAGAYHLIENKTTPIFILCDESSDLYNRIRYKPFLSRDDYRAMQQYTVQVYENFIKDNIGKIGKEPQGYWKWYGTYDKDYGISSNAQLDTLIV
ncbi:MAG TPA: CRISPR-associated helicase/endonuclease Cas3 [Prolixibacteraceae bacterium]|nr:CRISPR-associated helicase/endonuclease Cas3 [Prolixibacteraceae bacterium]